MAAPSKVDADVDSRRGGLWAAIVLLSTLFGFAAGYGVSLSTGIEPGYFEAPEAGGYGVAPSGPKMSEDVRKYYEDLTK